MMPRHIDAHEALVKTATVEVRTLTISGKQVTLAVFRQLQNEPLLDPYTGEFLGTPWGTVNYFWGRCQPDHLHVVWQKASELRRSCVHRYTSACAFTPGAWHTAITNAAWLMVIGEAQLPGKEFGSISRTKVESDNGWTVSISPSDVHYRGIDAARKMLVEDAHSFLGIDVSERDAASPIYACHYLGLLCEAQKKEQERVVVARSKWAQNYARLQDLEQLFIAV